MRQILFWDTGGFCLFCKRLERGRFRLPNDDNPEINRIILAMIIEGFDVKKVKKLPRFKPKIY